MNIRALFFFSFTRISAFLYAFFALPRITVRNSCKTRT